MKKIMLLADGTWGKETYFPLTNIALLHKFFIRSKSQVVFYEPGVGSHGDGPWSSPISWDFMENLYEGITGASINIHIKNIYRYLCLNYEVGDEVFCSGFSRGAYTVRSICGMIRKAGILDPKKIIQETGWGKKLSDARIHSILKKLSDRINIFHTNIINKLQKSNDFTKHDELSPIESKAAKLIETKIDLAFKLYQEDNKTPDTETAIKFRDKNCHFSDIKNHKIIKGLGVFDTVGSIGIPIPLIGFIDVPKFHNITLSKIIVNALHLVAIDEKRKAFMYTPMKAKEGTKLDQVFCAGSHADLGGGNPVPRDNGQPHIANLHLQKMRMWFELLEIKFDKGILQYQNSKDYLDKLHIVGFKPIALFFDTPRKIDINATVLAEVVKRYKADPKYKPYNLVEWMDYHRIYKGVKEVATQTEESYLMDNKGQPLMN